MKEGPSNDDEADLEPGGKELFPTELSTPSPTAASATDDVGAFFRYAAHPFILPLLGNGALLITAYLQGYGWPRQTVSYLLGLQPPIPVESESKQRVIDAHVFPAAVVIFLWMSHVILTFFFQNHKGNRF